MSNWEGWPGDEETRNLLLRFFIDFARFEYAMKTSGFEKNANGYLKPDYSKLKNSMQKKPLPNSIKKDHQYLWNSPPQRRVSVEQWDSEVTGEEWDFIIDCIKTVRNNLFHGEKFPFDTDRDVELICHCSVVLRTLIEHAPEDLRRRFWGAA